MRALSTFRRIAQLLDKTPNTCVAGPMSIPTKQQFCSATLAPNVVHNAKERRFVLPIDGHEAELQYRMKGSTIHMDHTEVPKELEGRGLGKILAKVCLSLFYPPSDHSLHPL